MHATTGTSSDNQKLINPYRALCRARVGSAATRHHSSIMHCTDLEIRLSVTSDVLCYPLHPHSTYGCYHNTRGVVMGIGVTRLTPHKTRYIHVRLYDLSTCTHVARDIPDRRYDSTMTNRLRTGSTASTTQAACTHARHPMPTHASSMPRELGARASTSASSTLAHTAAPQAADATAPRRTCYLGSGSLPR